MQLKPTDIRPGDRAIIRYCSFISFDTHKAKVVGEACNINGMWLVPVVYWCGGTRYHAQVPYDKLVKIRSSRVKISKSAIITGSVLAFIVLCALWFGGNFNDMVRARNQVDNKFSTIDVHEQERMDKIGMLLNATTGSQIQEQEVFKSIADGRKTYQSATTDDEKVAASQQISTNLALLPRLQENYPELKSNTNVQTLMKEMSGIEVVIAGARKDYNETATNYNTNISSVPKLFFANSFGFTQKPLYRADTAAKQAPKTDTTDKLRN